MSRALAVVATLLVLAHADLYMHNPRGSNNRLNEQSAARDNGDRMFDSQNNARGGYNVGDKWDMAFASKQGTKQNPDGYNTASAPNSFDVTLGFSQTYDSYQYNMIYFEDSELTVEWTAQHGCGGNEQNDPHKQNCQMIVQYVCDTDNSVVTDPALQVRLRDGSTTRQSDAPNTDAQFGAQEIARAMAENDVFVADQNNPTDIAVLGRHENEASYYECRARKRNKGLFVADQRLNGDEARFTRQNPNGNRRGLECAEERDYFPYWRPTIWRDIAVLTDDVPHCQSAIAPDSQNVVTKYKCVDPSGQFEKTKYYAFTKDECETGTNPGSWRGFTHNLPQPMCIAAEWGRENHLGNGRNGQPLNFNWTIPSFATLQASGVKIYSDPVEGDYARCVLRLRYNITTDDYDPYNTDWRQNPNDNRGTVSPVYKDPTIDVGVDFVDFDNQEVKENEQPLKGLRLAIDTNQFGRTFQDRSHVFLVKKRQLNVAMLLAQTPGNATVRAAKTLNLNVRGKRGNIVQTYPSVEYDFMPNHMHVRAGDLIHIQWTGSNTHNNGGNAGDGQAGDAGQGTTGTDRHNFVQLADLHDNFPIPYDKMPNMFDDLDCFDISGAPLSTLDCQIRLAVAGHYQSAQQTIAEVDVRPLDPLLNTGAASFKKGVLVKFKPSAAGKKYYYMCTRNNSFSNRSQKGTIVVDP